MEDDDNAHPAGREINRLVTSVALIGVIALVLALQGKALLIAVLLVSALCLWEFYSLFWGKTGRIPSRICAIALGWGMIFLTWIRRPQDALVCLGAGFVLASLTFLFRWDVVEEENAFAPSGIFMAGLAYVPLLLLPATYLSNTKILFVLGAVAVSDSAAWFVGTRFGRHKLWPRVSPKKSSEGAVASLIACVLFCTVYGTLLGKTGWISFMLLGIVINAFSQLGDLFESALKRSVRVKDSGTLLPGHGGMLDRVDSFLFVLPMVAVVDQWFFFF
ncbi:MAG: phosphatidate cytidylyltransferase [Candidatus Desulfovibrio kirbyi]|jgi:phosphatidate cytidylyltransferase|uniref:Phosphatidate cytidylyltransferase n=1 Tax=Candidatus Desulfovibrio kirbyi TaxID=2696086 RepID=A0A6L2R485_9BACT|nr:phosphatidate cytidylyltransferase [Desulfovibrio sp.]GFH62388.1 MAG: phosphatidate cytidylyltransferase [Candidatus Desulfovibrio kirbyi]